ncbi:MAG: NfeD family protein [Thermoplasmatales archaeon]|nr:NfeD family protein [Thermoplasmatales archaeon]
MDPVIVSAIIVAIGAVFVIGEVFSPGAFMIVPGTVLIIVGIIGIIYPDFLFSWNSPIVAILVTAPITIVTIYAYQQLAKPEPPTTTVTESLVGRVGTVTVATSPDNLRGKIRIGTDVWSAASDEPIAEGEEARVVSATGVHVRVKKIA